MDSAYEDSEYDSPDDTAVNISHNESNSIWGKFRRFSKTPLGLTLLSCLAIGGLWGLYAMHRFDVMLDGFEVSYVRNKNENDII